jgi:hypothetical protein
VDKDVPVSQQEYHEVFKETMRRCLHNKMPKLQLDNLQRATVIKVIQELLDGGLIDEVGEEVERTFGRHLPSAAQPRAVSQQRNSAVSASGVFTSDAPTVAPPTPTFGTAIGFPDAIHHHPSGGIQTDSENRGISSNFEASATQVFFAGTTSHLVDEEWDQFFRASVSGGFTSDAPTVASPTPTFGTPTGFADAIHRNPSSGIQTD